MGISSSILSTQYIYVIGRNKYGEFGLNHKENVEILKLAQYNCKINNIKCGLHHNVYIDDNDNYWSAGNNEYGQCGIDNDDEATLTITNLTEIKYFKENKIKIKKICTSIGGECTFWITDKNQLYGNGSNHYHLLGVDTDLKQEKPYSVSKPVLIDGIYNVIDIVSGWDYSLALCSENIKLITNCWYTTNVINNSNTLPNDINNLIQQFYGNTNKVFSINAIYHSKPFNGHSGGNGHGFHSNDNNDATYWQQIEKLKTKEIIKIKCGYQHSLFLESNGTLWCCGKNNYGVLGLSHTNNIYIPTKIKYFIDNGIKIKDISCGLYHNLAIDYKNKIYSWGRNILYECGHPNYAWNATHINTPKLIDSLKHFNIEEICCGKSHSYVKTNDGKHFLFGNNKYNQCLKLNEATVNLPYLINKRIEDETNDKIIKHVYLGYESTMFILSDKNDQ